MAPGLPPLNGVRFPAGDLVEVHRDGETVGSLLGAYDPVGNLLYAPAGSDVIDGDSVELYGTMRRVLGTPQDWTNAFTGWNAGMVIQLQELAPHLPDAGTLYRSNGTTWDKQANTEVPAWTQLWSGPCLVLAPTTDGSEALAGEQRVTVQPYTVSVPLELTDIRTNDRLEVTATSDLGLVGRSLQVTRVRAHSVALVRQFTAIDNQG